MKLEYYPKTNVSTAELAEYKKFALELAAIGGKTALPYFRGNFEVENKLQDGGFDPVTIADKSVEENIRDAIGARYPNHGIYGEEQAMKPTGENPDQALTWVIDPIDGTRAFMTGMLHWGVLVALFDGDTPIVGTMHQPFTNEYFVGDGTSAEYIRGDTRTALRVRACPSLDQAVLTATGPQFFKPGQEEDCFSRLSQKVKLLRWGGDCYMYGMLAMGQIDIVAEAGLNPYDIQALIPIIRGAGGFITSWQASNPSMGGCIVACGDERIFSAVLDQLRH